KPYLKYKMLTKKSRIPQGVADVFDSIELRNSGK
ncbi:hypothetical protein M2149_002531, partial [Lachnospiraceae bacterium PFB1-21]